MSKLEITNVSVNKQIKEDSKLRGYATVIINDAIAIHNIRILEGNHGPFIAMPSRKTDEDKYMDIVHPITNDIRNQLNDAIIRKYSELENK